MTLFTKEDCDLCKQLKKRYDLEAMDVNVEVLNSDSSRALAHLAWHSLVETARKTLPLLVLDDSSTVIDFPNIENHLGSRAKKYGLSTQQKNANVVACDSGKCAL